MRVLFVAVLLLITGAPARSEDHPLKGGKSPDGKYEVRVFKNDRSELSNYYYGLYDLKTKKVVKKMQEGGGFTNYDGAQETAEVLWHPSSRFFALTDHGSRHSMELYVYRLSPSSVELLKAPDYFQNALGRIGATECYLTSVVKPVRWEENALVSELTFDAYETREEGVQGRSPFYHVTFWLEITEGSSFLRFTRMEKPKADSGS